MLSEATRSPARFTVLVFCATLLATGPVQTWAAPQITTVSGKQENVQVPSVSEPWSATVGRVTEPPAPLRWHIGHYPGFREAKRQANARRKALMSARSQSGESFVGPQSEQAPTANTTDQFAAPSSTSGVVFDGPSESDTHLIPPDSQIAAGPNHVVVAVNSLLAIYDKSGNLQGSFQNFSSFFSSLGITGEIFDPRIIYDQTDQRFILSAGEIDFTNLTNGHVFLAVSATSDPTGTWYKFAINSMRRNLDNTANTFPDFPGLGLSQSAVYITTNQYRLTQTCLSTDTDQCFFSDAQIKVIGLPELLSGNPNLNITAFANVQTAHGFPAFAIQPALTYGSSNEEFLVAARFDNYVGTALDLFAIPTSGAPTLSTADLAVPAYQNPPDVIPGGNYEAILTNDFRPLNALWKSGSLFLGQNVYSASSAGENALARWYQITLPDLTSASLAQSGDTSGNGDAYYPAVSLKADGTLGIAFTTSSTLQVASAAFTARNPSDPPGTTRGYSIYRAGSDSYDEPNGRNRWGDYSGISQDPDGNSLWMITEYAGSPDPRFATAVGQITTPPALLASPSKLTFQNALVGVVSGPLSVTVINISATSVTIGTISVSGANPTDFSISSDLCSGTSLPAGQSCMIAITFKPSINNWEDGLLSIRDNTGNLLTVGMTGFGRLQAILSFNPPTLTFPPTVLQSASAPQVVTFMNSGNVSARLNAPAVVGDFTQTNNCGSSLAAGASCTFSVTFRPTTSGTEQGTLSYSQSSIAYFSGIGTTAPAALFCPSSLTFPNQTINSISPAQPVILSNNGSAPLSIAKISIIGDFSEVDDCVGSLPARSACVINVTFTPSATGARSGTFTVVDNAQGSPQAYSLTGVGTAGSANILALPQELASAIQWNTGEAGGDPSGSPKARPKQGRAEPPLYFEPNAGQFGSGVEFVAHAQATTLALTRIGLYLRFAAPSSKDPGEHSPPHRDAIHDATVTNGSAHSGLGNTIAVTMTMEGGNQAAHASGLGELAGKSNYFIGNDPKRWRTNVPTYARVKLSRIYPGIDLVYYGTLGQLEYDFVVEPHADPNAIRLRFEGASGVRIAKSGQLVLSTPTGEVSFHKPVVYQAVVAGHGPSLHASSTFAQRHPQGAPRQMLVDGCYVLTASNEVRFEIGAYDKSKELVIDPVLSFSTYLAGSNKDSANAIAVDASGNSYVAGTTYSPDFPVTSGALKSACGSASRPCVTVQGQADAFISKLGPNGSLIYSTYVGGGQQDEALAIAIDASGSAYVTGTTESSDFPVTQSALQTSCLPLADNFCDSVFVAKLNPAGSALLYSTYLGGATPNQSSSNEGLGIAVDSTGNAYVGGLTDSLNFPTTPGAFQTSAAPLVLGSPGHGFLSKLSPSGSNLVFSTFLGGSRSDKVNGVTLDILGNVYVGGETTSVDFPTTAGAFQSGSYDDSSGGESFIAKFSSSGSILYSTYFGGPKTGNGSGTQAKAIAVDSTGAAYIAGSTADVLPAIPGAYEITPFSVGSAFITKFHPAGCALIYSTYVGYNDFGFQGYGATSIALDSSNNAYITGNANLITSPGFSGPSLLKGIQPPMSSYTALISELDPTGSTLLFSSFLGGSGQNTSNGISVGPSGDIFVAGATSSPDFPMANPIQTTCPACELLATGAYVTKIGPQPANAVLLTRNSLTFGPRPIGSSNIEVQTIGLMNQLSTNLNISSVTVGGGSFSLANIAGPSPILCTGSIAPGTGCVVRVQFTPSTFGPQSGTLTISDNGPGSPRLIALSGSGTADFKLTAGANPILTTKQTDSAQLTINASSAPGVVSPSGDVALACTGASPATCVFNPASIPATGANSTLTISGLSSVSNNVLTFSVVGTLGGQSYSLPLSMLFQDFSVTASQSSATVRAGQTATYSLSVVPSGGYNYPVNLACSNAPTLTICSISPQSVVLDGTSSVPLTVTVTTTAPSSTLPTKYRPRSPWGFRFGVPLAWLLIMAMFLALISATSAKRRRAWLGLALITLVLGLWVSCGGGGGGGGGSGGGGAVGGTAPGVYTLTVAGNSFFAGNNLSRSISLTLNVQ